MKCHQCSKEFSSKAYTTKDNLCFCSRSCLASYTNKNRKHSSETKLKIAKSLKERNRSKNKEISKNKNKESSKNKENSIKFCKFCGKQNCTTPHICNSEFIQRKSKNLEKLGFDLSTIGTIKVIEEYNRIKSILENLYIHQLYSMPMILKMFNLKDYRTLYSIFNFFKITRRTRSEARKVSILCDRSKIQSSFRYKCGNHISWDNKMYWFRSSYEEDYMNLLDKNKIFYIYEPFRITYFDTKENTIRIAVPDFYLPQSNTIVEIKSKYTYNKSNMEDKVREYRKLGYNFKLVLEHIEYSDCI